MSERVAPSINPFSQQTAAAAEMVQAAHLDGIEKGIAQGHAEALGLIDRIPVTSRPTGWFRRWWDRVTGRTAAREEGRSETMLHILVENARAKQEGFREGQLAGVILVANTAAHKINNAISPIQGYADLLLASETVASDADLFRFATLITDSVEMTTKRLRELPQIRRIVLDESNPDTPMLNMEESIKPEDPQP